MKAIECISLFRRIVNQYSDDSKYTDMALYAILIAARNHLVSRRLLTMRDEERDRYISSASASTCLPLTQASPLCEGDACDEVVYITDKLPESLTPLTISLRGRGGFVLKEVSPSAFYDWNPPRLFNNTLVWSKFGDRRIRIKGAPLLTEIEISGVFAEDVPECTCNECTTCVDKLAGDTIIKREELVETFSIASELMGLGKLYRDDTRNDASPIEPNVQLPPTPNTYPTQAPFANESQ